MVHGPYIVPKCRIWWMLGPDKDFNGTFERRPGYSEHRPDYLHNQQHPSQISATAGFHTSGPDRWKCKTVSSQESNRSGTGFSSGDGIIHLCPGYSSGSQVSWGWCQLRLVSAHACPGWVPGWLALEQRILSNLLVWFGAAFLLNPLFETSVSA